MFAQVEINKNENGTVVIIKQQKILFFKIFLIVFMASIIVLPVTLCVLIISGRMELGLQFMLGIGLSIILTVFIYKHLRRAFRKEILIIDKDKLTYENSFLGIGKYFEAKRNAIRTFKYLGYEHQSKHPLEITGDVLGFGTAQGEINYLNQTGTMLLATEYEGLKFGLDVADEDYSRIKEVIHH